MSAVRPERKPKSLLREYTEAIVYAVLLTIVLRAFGCGCFDDWSDEPPGEREQRARGAVAALVSTILESQRGDS